MVDYAVIDSCVVFRRISILSGPEDAQITIETDDNKKSRVATVRSDFEERVVEERPAWNDKNIPAWPKNISVL